MNKITSQEKAKLIAFVASDKKGKDILLMDMRHISGLCDWFVLISAGTPRQINAISKHIRTELSKKKVRPLSVEGKKDQDWLLLDYEDVVVHIFHKHTREFYDLEHLWTDAPKEYIEDRCQ